MKKFALVGCGNVAVHHAENIVKVGKLAAVCDMVPEKAEAFANTYGATAYYQFDDLLAAEKDVELVVVCTPNGLHAEHTIKSLQAKKHVLCESPLCLSAAAAWQIIETEKFCRRRLFVANEAVSHPLLQKIRIAFEEGTIGKVYSFHLHCVLPVPDDYFADWRGKIFPGGGLLYTTFSRHIDAITFIFGEIGSVQGYKVNAAHQNTPETEDTGVVALQMQNGSLGTLHWSVNSRKDRDVSLTIIAEKSTLRIYGEDLSKIEYAEPENLLPAQPVANGPLSHEPAARLKPLYDDLVLALENKTTSIAEAFDGLKTVAAIEKIYKAISGA